MLSLLAFQASANYSAEVQVLAISTAQLTSGDAMSASQGVTTGSIFLPVSGDQTNHLTCAVICVVVVSGSREQDTAPCCSICKSYNRWVMVLKIGFRSFDFSFHFNIKSC